jgi:hypothetical protein
MSLSSHSTEVEASSRTTRKVLETCLTETHASYQALLTQLGNLDHCREAGKTIRHLAQCLVDLDLVSDDEETSEDDFSDSLNDE